MNLPTPFRLLLATAILALSARPLTAQAPSADHGNPLSALHAHVCGFHFYRDDPSRALRVHHYCAHVTGQVFQCVIYDSPAPRARLIGVEYIISEALFIALSPEEKTLWHSHRYEVMSGLLTAPGADATAEKKLMAELVTTYGKTWHLWQVDRGDTLPLGLPQLMMGFTADGQIDPALVATRDRELGVTTVNLRAARADLPTRPIAPGADARPQPPSQAKPGGPEPR
jgi:hypothetical protein